VSSRCSVVWGRYRRAIVTVLLGVLAASATFSTGDGIGLLDGLVYDLSLAITDRRPGTRDEPVAVIALDRDSLASDELAALPRVFLSPVWTKIVNGLTEAGARAIGFDIIFSYSANRFPGFEGQYDRDFLAALARRARTCRAGALGRVLPGRRPSLPPCLIPRWMSASPNRRQLVTPS